MTYLQALEAVAKIAKELEWRYELDDGSMEESYIGTCPWCACNKKEGHHSCPFGAALARLRKIKIKETVRRAT